MIEWFGLSDPGLERENNEDGFLGDPDRALFVVADGMGGHRGGEVASAMLIEALAALPPPGDRPWATLRAGVLAANEAILARAAAPGLRGMGATCTALHLGPELATLIQVGDSRAYFLSHDLLSGGPYLELLTRDQTVYRMLVDLGHAEPDEDEERHSPLLQAVGRRGLRPQPYVIERARAPAWLLCSDGLSGVVPAAELEAWIRRDDLSLEEICRELVGRANELGGPDNITVLLVRDATQR